MLRIMTSDKPTFTLITVDGQLLGEYLDTAETCCTQATSKGKPVQLFLRTFPSSAKTAADSSIVWPRRGSA
jgi:hypothetical protein